MIRTRDEYNRIVDELKIATEIGWNRYRDIEKLSVQVIGSSELGLLVAENLLEFNFKEVCLRQFEVNKGKANILSELLRTPSFTFCNSMEFSTSEVENYDLVIDCAFDYDLSIEINNNCHKLNKGYVKGDIVGDILFNFFDFGKHFSCFETEPNKTINPVFITDIFQHPHDKSLLIIRTDYFRKDIFQVNFEGHENHFKFTEVRGRVGSVLNNTQESFEISPYFTTNTKGKRERRKYCFLLNVGKDLDVEEAEYLGGGRLIQEKQPIIKSFRTLEDSINYYVTDDNSLLPLDYNNFGISSQLLRCLQAYWAFQNKYKRLPNRVDMDEIIAIIEANFKDVSVELDKKIVSEFLQNTEDTTVHHLLEKYMANMLTQEAVKYSGYGILESQISILEFQSLDFASLQNLSSKRILVFAENAIFTEWIEQLNQLNKKLNQSCEVILICENKAESDSTFETIALSEINLRLADFGSKIKLSYLIDWDTIDIVISLGNDTKIEKKIDEECILYEKKVIFLSTFGSKFNVLQVQPNKTITLSEIPGQDKPFDLRQMCLSRFVSNLEDCIYQAKSSITQEVFNEYLIDFVEDPPMFISKMKNDKSASNFYSASCLKYINRQIRLEQKFEAIVIESFEIFFKLFRDMPVFFTRQRKKNAKLPSGDLFWNNQERRMPSIVRYSSSNISHLKTILLLANTKCLQLGIFESEDDFVQDVHLVRDILKNVKSPPLTTNFRMTDIEVESSLSSEDTRSKSENKSTHEFLEEIEQLEVFLKSSRRNRILDIKDGRQITKLQIYHELVFLLTDLYSQMYSLEMVSYEKFLEVFLEVTPWNSSTAKSAVSSSILILSNAFATDTFYEFSSNGIGGFHLLLECQKRSKAKGGTDILLLQDYIVQPKDFSKWDKIIIEGSHLTLQGFLLEFEKITQKRFGTRLKITCLVHWSASENASHGYSKLLVEDIYILLVI